MPCAPRHVRCSKASHVAVSSASRVFSLLPEQKDLDIMCAPHGVRRLVLMCLVLLPLALVTEGCGGGEGTVSGKVLYKGEPVKGGTVNFWPEGKGVNVPSVIGLDGSYKVSKLPPGPARISVVVGGQGVPSEVFKGMRNPQRAEKGMQQVGRIGKAASTGGGEEGKESALNKDRVNVPQKYSDPETSELTVTVTGGSQKHDIELK